MAGATNSFEGGTNGVTITDLNSGGASGDPFDGTDGATFSSTRAAHGLLSARLAANGNQQMSYFLSGTGNRWFRLYLYSSSWSSQPYVFQAYSTGSTNYNSTSIQMMSSGIQVDQFSESDSATTATINTAPATNQWIRVEFQLTSASSGACQIRLFNSADSTTATATDTGSFAQTARDWEQAYWQNSGTTDVYHDEIGWSDVNWLGPGSDPLPPVPSARRRSFVSVHRSSSW